MNFPKLCIRRPVFTIVLSLILVVLGVIGFLRIPVRGYPNIDPPVISIMTTYTGASPSIIESQVTTPIENDLVGAPGLETMLSTSQQGQSKIILKYRLGVDINNAVSDVRDRLAQISEQIPTEADQPIIQKRDPNSLQTVILALSDSRMTPMELTDYANRFLVPQIEQLLGVAAVEIYNERDYAMRISLHPRKMAANNVTVNDLINILKQQNVNVPSGQIKSPQRYYSVMTQGQLTTAKSFQDLIIRDTGGYLLRFGDVANIYVGPEDTDSAMRVNGNSAIGLGVYSETTANPITVAAGIKKSLIRLQNTLPEGMKIHVVWDETTYLKASLQTVYKDLAFAILLVVLVVTLFLGSLRSAFIPIITIPICLIGVFAFIYFLGYSINVFTLLALVLAIGLVVDDAIVMLENIYRYMESGMSAYHAALKGSSEIAFAVIAMTLTLAAVYAPIGFATGMTGIIFREFAFTLALAVILSGFVALSLSPMMCSKLLKIPDKKTGFQAKYSVWLDNTWCTLMGKYRKILSIILNYRWAVILFLLIFAGFGYLAFKSLPSQLAPKEDMGGFMVTVTPPPNASFSYTNNYSQKVEQYLRSLPSVQSVLMMVDPDQGGFGIVILKPWSERKISAQQLIKKVMHQAHAIPGVQVGAFNMSQIGGGGRYGDSVRMSISTNETYLQLHNTVEQFLKKIDEYPGINNPQQDLRMNYLQYVIKVKRDLAAALLVNVQDITDTLSTMLGGTKVTTFSWNDRDYDVLLQIPEKKLKDLQVINELYVRNANGQMIPLSTLATISEQVAPQILPHTDRLRSDTITLQVTPGYSMGQVVNYLKQAAKVDLPSGYRYQFKGVAQKMLEASHTMIGSFILALVFIYLVLAAQFESFLDPFIVMFSVPLSIVGALFTLKLTGSSLNIYTNIGFVTLIGLIAKHGILITEFANQQRREQGKPLKEALIDAAALRLRPILMTTAAMVIGAIPLAFAHGAGALGRQSIGWVIVGGLLFGTFFSLIVVPVAYSYFGRFKK